MNNKDKLQICGQQSEKENDSLNINNEGQEKDDIIVENLNTKNINTNNNLLNKKRNNNERKPKGK